MGDKQQEKQEVEKPQQQASTSRARQIDLEEVLDHVLDDHDGVGGAKQALEKPVPLGMMIDVLVEIWESEGLYDSL